MSLPVPQITNATIRKSGSTSSLGNSAIEHEHDLNPVTSTSRRSSFSSVTPARAASPSLVRPATTHSQNQTTLYAGKSRKPIVFATSALQAKSPYFQKLLAETPDPLPEQTTFEDADEFAMVLFGHWVTDKKLGGPTDFHSCGHYLGLYVLSQKFGCEALGNDVMDHMRTYYHTSRMTASPFRCQYIYTYTLVPNPMRTFLISTAAWRALYDHSDPNTHSHANGAGTEHDSSLSTSDHGLSSAMKEILSGNETMSLDFIQALIEFGRDGGSDGKGDPREGLKCVWHCHESTTKCVEEGLQPWEQD